MLPTEDGSCICFAPIRAFEIRTKQTNMSGRLALKPGLRPVSNEEVQAGAARALQHGIGTGVAVKLAGVPPSPLQALAAAADVQAGRAGYSGTRPAGAEPGSSGRKRKAEDSPSATAIAGAAGGAAPSSAPASGRTRRASTQKRANKDVDSDWNDTSDEEEASNGA